MASRSYRLGARGQAVEERKERILRNAFQLLRTRRYDEVTLQSIADAGDVSLKTVVRYFGTKENLIVCGSRLSRKEEHARRSVDVDVMDPNTAIRTLARRYEQLGDSVLQHIDMEQRVPGLRPAVAAARAGHIAWLESVFAEWLPHRGAERSRRVMALFAATELYVWWTWRNRLGLSATEAELTMSETIHALLERWEHKRAKR